MEQDAWQDTIIDGHPVVAQQNYGSIIHELASVHPF